MTSRIEVAPLYGPLIPQALQGCKTCSESIALSTLDEEGERLRLEADKSTVGPTLDYLNSLGFSDIHIGMALRLGIHAAKKWRGGDITKGEIRLLWLLRALPWLLPLSAQGLDNEFAKQVCSASTVLLVEEEEKWHERHES